MAGEKLLRLSSELCEIYYDLLVKDIAFTFSNNLEQHLWKQAFHKIIDGMKKGTNSLNTNAKAIRTLLLQLIDEVGSSQNPLKMTCTGYFILLAFAWAV